MTMQNPWLSEVSQNDPYTYTIQLNTETAARKGVKEGDLVWLENPKGSKARGRVHVTDGIRPDHVAIAANAGHWSKGLPYREGTKESLQRAHRDRQRAYVPRVPRQRHLREGETLQDGGARGG